MVSIIKIAVLAFSFCLVSKVTLQQPCTVSSLKFSQVQTGVKVQNKPQWKVTVKNDCICTQSNIQLSCTGFQTAEKIDPSVLTIGKDVCLLLEDGRIFGFQNLSFTYAWDSEFPFKAISSNIACS